MNKAGPSLAASQRRHTAGRGNPILITGLLLAKLFVVPEAGTGQKPEPPTAKDRAANSPPICANCGGNPDSFIVHSYQGQMRCLDYTPEKSGSPVFISDCKTAHPVVIEELGDGKHTVVLHAGSKVIGIPYHVVTTPGDGAPPAPAETPLQLLGQGVTTASGNDFFALDGDSITPASDHDLVAKVQNVRGAAGTPVVLGSRDLADSEFWDFVAMDGSGRDPTSGFHRVSTKIDLLKAISEVNAVARANNGAAWGNVIRIIDAGAPISLTDNTAVVCDPTAYTCDPNGPLSRSVGESVLANESSQSFGCR